MLTLHRGRVIAKSKVNFERLFKCDFNTPLIDSVKRYQWGSGERERDTHVAGVGGNGQKLRESGIKKTLGCALTHMCYPISTPIISAVSFCLWQHISDHFWNSAIKIISNLIQALSRTYGCFQVLSRPWIHMSEIQVLSSTFKKRGNPVLFFYII